MNISGSLERFSVLVIAPNRDLAEMAQVIAPSYPELAVTVHEGDLDQGLAAALESLDSYYDVAISRGGTARLLEEEVAIPVIEVGTSVTDLLGALAAHGLMEGRVAVVGFSNVVESLEGFASYAETDLELDLFPISFEDELPLVVESLRGAGYDGVFCDTLAHAACVEAGLPAHLLGSGARSVAKAFDQALQLCRQIEELRSRNSLLWQLLNAQPGKVALMASDGRLVFSNLEAHKGELLAFMRGHLDSNQAWFSIQRGRRTYRIRRTALVHEGERMAAFTVSSSPAPLREELAGIRVLSRDEVEAGYRQSTFRAAQGEKGLEAAVTRAAAQGRPVLLEGEAGAGVRRVADLLYLTADWSRRPYVSVDCGLVTAKSWEFLLQSSHSPFYEGEQTIYVRALHRLEGDRLHRLIEAVERTGVAERNHVLFSAVGAEQSQRSEALGLLVRHLRCHVVRVPPLREREDLGDALRSALRELPAREGAGPVAVDEEGWELLARYSWPGNYPELSRVVGRLAEESCGERVGADAVLRALGAVGAQGAGTPAGADEEALDLSRPLRDIEQDVVRAVLERCGGNQSEAARSLGISRTTLWRMLKEG